MTKITQFFVLGAFALLLVGCGGSKDYTKVSPSAGEYKEVNDPFSPLRDEANQVIAEGGIAVVGQGVSPRQDLAIDIAQERGRSDLAAVLETKVQRLSSSFIEQIGSNNNPQINETFKKVLNNVTKQKITGSFAKRTKLTKNDATGQYMAAALMVVDPKSVNNSIIDEIKKTDSTTWNLFRESKAMDQLKKEMEDYDKK